MTKIIYMLKESFYMIKKYKAYFLAPVLIMLIFLALVVFYIGPGVVISFIYAGI
jgi:hypothetical protein